MNTISVVLPVYRNAEALAALHARLIGALETEAESLELIYVDDACTAGSGAVLNELARPDDPHAQSGPAPRRLASPARVSE